ncbi:hypothetical protein, partial [Serratia symbiotica]|uniref:hypothetical protein n=1 Tax=Serratia symbiotica TaxID=138074 RepID=UPI001E4835D6
MQRDHGNATAQQMPSHSKANSTTAIPQRSTAEAVNKVFNDVSVSYRDVDVNFMANKNKEKICDVIILHHKPRISSSLLPSIIQRNAT